MYALEKPHNGHPTHLLTQVYPQTLVKALAATS